ncbi:aromatic acid exporter family protein [Agrobacterium tumefaciens]|nr:aromatic acid exporter family protein [Agrobacterium tumefaciens]
MLRQIAERLRSTFTRAFAAALAAAFAFWASRHLLGHQQPVFAAISALICLAPGIPSQIRQGMGLIVGVTVGIVVGELALVIPAELAELRMASATFVAMMIAVAFGMPPVVPIQAGASAMLVLLMGPQVAGLARFLDVLIGASTGLIVAFVFFRERLKF